MLTRQQMNQARKRAAAMLADTGIVLAPGEEDSIEVADFGLGRLDEIGLQVLTYVSTDRYSAKELVLFPRQMCPEHKHPPFSGNPGKMETLRCRRGTLWLYVEGDRSDEVHAAIPRGCESSFTVFREIHLDPGEQHTVAPGTLHWFQAGDEGAVVSSFASATSDEQDIFTDPRVERKTKIEEGR